MVIYHSYKILLLKTHTFWLQNIEKSLKPTGKLPSSFGSTVRCYGAAGGEKTYLVETQYAVLPTG